MVNVDLSFAGFETNTRDLPEASVAHLLQLGFSTKIKNAIAGVKAGILSNTSKNPWSDDDILAECSRLGIDQHTLNGRDEKTANAICDALQREMFDSIVSGVARASRSSRPRLSDDDKLREAIAIEKLTALAKQSGKALPKRSKPEEKAAFADLLSKAMASTKVSPKDGLTFAQRVEKDFKARKKAAESVSDDFDDLIG